jgi:hypothetical protein
MTKNNDTDLTNKSDTEVIKIARKLTSPKSDFWFKKIFGEHKDICKNFIESVTGLHINSLEYGNTESLGDLFGTKKICFDVNAIIDNGMRVESRAGEFHPHPLAEPDVSLSTHPAPIIQNEKYSPFQ